MPDLVECYSGSRYAERPKAFYWQGDRLEIEEVQDRWRTPAGLCFRVRAGQNQIYELVYQEHSGNWQVRPAGL
jgi:hypothetical protein